jgi:hypothetical protein
MPCIEVEARRVGDRYAGRSSVEGSAAAAPHRSPRSPGRRAPGPRRRAGPGCPARSGTTSRRSAGRPSVSMPSAAWHRLTVTVEDGGVRFGCGAGVPGMRGGGCCRRGACRGGDGKAAAVLEAHADEVRDRLALLARYEREATAWFESQVGSLADRVENVLDEAGRTVRGWSRIRRGRRGRSGRSRLVHGPIPLMSTSRSPLATSRRPRRRVRPSLAASGGPLQALLNRATAAQVTVDRRRCRSTTRSRAPALRHSVGARTTIRVVATPGWMVAVIRCGRRL